LHRFALIVSQSSRIFAFLILAFLVFTIMRGSFRKYWGFLLG